MQVRATGELNLTSKSGADFRNRRADLTGAYLKYVTERLQARSGKMCRYLALGPPHLGFAAFNNHRLNISDGFFKTFEGLH